MNFKQSIKNLNRSLSKKKPPTFGPTWIKGRVRKSYDYIIKNIQTELGEPDWDRVVRLLDYQYQKLWLKGVRVKKKIVQYKNQAEVEIILSKHKDKLYTFLVQKDKEDKKICDLISIKLVRTAQKGNLLAKQKSMIFARLLIDQWIDGHNFKHWRGYDDKIEQTIERCIRCYRYSGSFIVYLYKTFEYAGRGLQPLEVFSLDSLSLITENRVSENLVYDTQTGEARFYSHKEHN